MTRNPSRISIRNNLCDSSMEVVVMLSFRISEHAIVGLLTTTLIGCGQAPLMNVEVSKKTSSNSSKETTVDSPSDDNDETANVTRSFLDEFHVIKNKCADQIKLIEEKIEKQFRDSVTTQEDENRLANQYQTECDAVTAVMIPRVSELVKPYLTEIVAVEPLFWLAEHDKSNTGLDAASLLLDVMKRNVTDPAALDALVWIATHKSQSSLGQEAVLLLMKHHLTSQKAIEMALRHHRQAWVETILRAQLAASELQEDMRPQLTFALAQRMHESAQRSSGDNATLDEAIQLYFEVQRKYADSEHRTGLKLGELATQALFEIENLSTGRLAPDIEGEDLDGVAFKLSDHRGKVVILSFWASWCGPCMAMVPHERELVRRFEGRPFVLIGINGDMDKSTVLPIIEKQKISWRSFWAGEKGPLGQFRGHGM